ncbi:MULTISPECIES: transposase family protein [unclassified Streptomyces]|uniref:transposase family protein n=1 Tax=unclassified Streptomyces TaxID=2593676 RepID=UPI0035DCC2BE
MVISLITPATKGAVPYPAMLDVPHELVEHVAWLLHEHRRVRSTRWRKLGCFQQALLALVHLRWNETFSQLGAGFGISQATAWRYVDETLNVLADRACQDAGATFRTPYYHHREQPEHYQQFNRDHARLRAPGERAFAHLKSWRAARRHRMTHDDKGTTCVIDIVLH